MRSNGSHMNSDEQQLSARVVEVILLPRADEREALDETVAAYGEAVLWAVRVGRLAGTTGNAIIHRRCYRELRERFDLSANLAIRAVARAASLLKAGHGPGATAWDGDLDYDARILSVSTDACTISLSTVRGRLRQIRFTANAVALGRLQGGRLKGGYLRRREGDYVVGLRIDLPTYFLEAGEEVD